HRRRQERKDDERQRGEKVEPADRNSSKARKERMLANGLSQERPAWEGGGVGPAEQPRWGERLEADGGEEGGEAIAEGAMPQPRLLPRLRRLLRVCAAALVMNLAALVVVAMPVRAGPSRRTGPRRHSRQGPRAPWRPLRW